MILMFGMLTTYLDVVRRRGLNCVQVEGLREARNEFMLQKDLNVVLARSWRHIGYVNQTIRDTHFVRNLGKLINSNRL